MTGFGEAATHVGSVHYAVELRSLNNRYFKATIRLPEQIAGLEAELESRLRKSVHRGSFTLTVKMRVSDEAAASRVNEAAVMEYIDHLETIHAKMHDQAVHIDLTQLLALPGVLQPMEEDEALMAKARPILLDLTAQAAQRLGQMRMTEGQALAGDLLTQRQAILASIEKIRERAHTVIDEYHEKLRARIDELMAKASLRVDEQDLVREVAIYADRADISEELSRLAGHLDQFQQIIEADNGEPAGRTLDFLAQELLREANTIASKSNDAPISRASVEVKSAIDRIKEQVQNVE